MEDIDKKNFASFYSSRHGKNRRHTCASGMGRTRTQDLAVIRQRYDHCATRVLANLNLMHAFCIYVYCKSPHKYHLLYLFLVVLWKPLFLQETHTKECM